MPLTRDANRRLVLVAHTPDAGFTELVGMAELDPATAFRGAPLRGVDLRRQDMAGFDLTGASLDRADVTGADLSRTLGLTPGMFETAVFDAATIWPAAMAETMRARIRPFPWADTWGADAYGRWLTFSVAALDGTRVSQRMRWMPPGRFMMGSPETEEGRWGDPEGPRHEVTIADGFWLFDTPCTQALWQAVTGDTRSRFIDPERPVEEVSFNDVQGFLDKINALVPGLDLSLPSEARWEYACRAGTDTATWAGDLDIRGDYNAPVLDAIAWYGGNSGVGFELENGYDSSKWPGKQYAHDKAGSRKVGQKAANPWGLYDMLGNVWEWCEDHWHGTYEGAPDDGSPWLAAGAAYRVIRGGSWDFVARYVRAAVRFRSDPGDRSDFLGFRCARVHVPGEAKAKAERRAGRSKPRAWSAKAATTGR